MRALINTYVCPYTLPSHLFQRRCTLALSSRTSASRRSACRHASALPHTGWARGEVGARALRGVCARGAQGPEAPLRGWRRSGRVAPARRPPPPPARRLGPRPPGPPASWPWPSEPAAPGTRPARGGRERRKRSRWRCRAGAVVDGGLGSWGAAPPPSSCAPSGSRWWPGLRRWQATGHRAWAWAATLGGHGGQAGLGDRGEVRLDTDLSLRPTRCARHRWRRSGSSCVPALALRGRKISPGRQRRVESAVACAGPASGRRQRTREGVGTVRQVVGGLDRATLAQVDLLWW